MTNKIEFENGSTITPTLTPLENLKLKNSRGKRANMLSYWSDILGCFVEFDGNKEVGNMHKYFILDENDDRIYIKIDPEHDLNLMIGEEGEFI